MGKWDPILNIPSGRGITKITIPTSSKTTLAVQHILHPPEHNYPLLPIRYYFIIFPE